MMRRSPSVKFIRRCTPPRSRSRSRLRSFSISSISSFEDDNLVRPRWDIEAPDIRRSREKVRERSRERSHSRKNKSKEHKRHRRARELRKEKERALEEPESEPEGNHAQEIVIQQGAEAVDESFADPSTCNFRATFKPLELEEAPKPKPIERLQSQANIHHPHENQINEQKADAGDDRIGRLEKLVELLVNNSVKNQANSSKPKSDNDIDGIPIMSRDIPELLPSNTKFTTSMWLNKIHEECLERDFDERTSLQFMQSRMSGIVKAWFKTVSSYDFTWPELKLLITKTFPDNADFASTLRILVNREKASDETITQYYFSKMYLCEACRITGENAVSCLIDGLSNPFMKQDIKGHNFLTPEALYSQYFVKFPENDIHHEQQRDVVEAYDPEEVIDIDEPEDQDYRMPPAPPSFNTDKKRCYTCKKMGHVAADCRHAPLCYICKKRGHIAAKCHFNKVLLLSTSDDTDRNFVNCEVNGTILKAYIDTGCSIVTMRKSTAEDLALVLSASTKTLQGYGGGTVKVLGEANAKMRVDFVECVVPIVVVPDDVQMFPILIGQPFLNREDVTMVMENNEVRLFEKKMYSAYLKFRHDPRGNDRSCEKTKSLAGVAFEYKKESFYSKKVEASQHSHGD